MNTKQKTVLKFTILILLSSLLFLYHYRVIDNDSWYALAEGRHIVEHGLYHIDPLSMHEGLEITVQNYGFAVLYWLVYSWFGPIGLYSCVIILNALLCFLLYKVFMLMSNKKETRSLILMFFTDLLLILLGFITTRAQLVSYIIFVILIYILELYVRKGKIKPLFLIPLLSLIQVNLHASLWPTLFLVMIVYIMDSPIQGHKAKPLILTLLASFLVGFLNPYGPNMLVFIIASYATGTIQRLVTEQAPFDLSSIPKILLYCSIASVLLLCIYGNKKDIRARYLILFFGFLAVGLNTIKGMSQFVLVMFFPIIPAYKHIYLPKIKLKPETKNIVLYGGCAGLSIIFVFMLVRNLKQLPNYPDETLSYAFNRLDEETEKDNLEKSSIKLYTGFNDGGYAEFRNYKPYLDPRAEVFLKINNKKDDILVEYINLLNGEIEKKDFLEKYDFDYVLLRSEFTLPEDYMKEHFELLYESDEPTTKLYKKK